MKSARGQMNDDELDVELLMYDLHRQLDATQFPGGRTVINFLFRGLPKFGHWWIVLENGARELCVDNPGKEIDVLLTTDLRTMAHISAGDMEIRAREEKRPAAINRQSGLNPDSIWLVAAGAIFGHVRPHAETLSPERSDRPLRPAPSPTRTIKRSSPHRNVQVNPGRS